MATQVNVEVDPESFRRLRTELFNFDRQLLFKLNQRIKRAVEPVATAAMSRASVLGTITDKWGRPSGIARQYNDGPKTVKVKVGGRASKSGNDAVVRMISDNVGVAIAEFADQFSTPEGAALVRKLGQYGNPGRFLWAATDAAEGTVNQAIRDEIRKTEQEYSERLAAGTASGVRR